LLAAIIAGAEHDRKGCDPTSAKSKTMRAVLC
jgi:hypothetical protein